MSKDFVPRSDTGFQAWVANFETYAGAHAQALGLELTDLSALLTSRMDFDAKIAASRRRSRQNRQRMQAGMHLRRWFESL